MALIVLFFLSSIFVFIDIEPLKTAGFFLSTCYLPGLTFFIICKIDRIGFDDLVLAFPCSVGISSALVLSMMFIGIHIEHIPYIIHVSVLAAIICYIVIRKKHGPLITLELDRQELLFCIFAFLLTALFSIPFFLGPNRISIAAHGFHHSALITQIMNGIFPPENPGMGGTAIGYYWAFHSFIAALALKTNLHQIQIIFILNAISMYFIFCISYRIARIFELSDLYSYIFPLAVLGLIKFDAGMLFLLKLFSGKLMSIEQITASPVEPYEVLISWLSGLPAFDTRLMFMRKFYNISGMPLALCLCFAYLLLLLLILKSGTSKNKSYIAGVCIVISACFFNYPPIAIFMLLHAPLWSGFIFLSRVGTFKEKVRESAIIMLPYIFSILIILPYMLYVVASRDVSSSGQGGIFRIDFYEQSLENIVGFLIPFPVILYGVRSAFKRLCLSKEMYFLLIGTVLCMILSIATRWPFDNSYKFTYILTFYLALFFIFALSDCISAMKNRCLKGVLLSAVVIALVLPSILVEASSIVSSFSTEYRYTFSGKHILYAEDKRNVFGQDREKNQAYAWIRENTPPESLVMLSYIESVFPCCGMNTNYEPAAIAERSLYIIKDRDYTTSNPEYEKRVFFREKLFEDPEDPGIADFFKSLNRQVYLLVEEDPTGRFLVEDRFKEFPDDPGKNFELVFRNQKQRVYQIRINR